MLTHKELTVPLSSYRILNEMKSICILTDPECKFAKNTGLDTVIKMLVYGDEDYYNADFEDDNKLKESFYDINYFRETRLDGVMPTEWKYMFGVNHPKYFLEANPKLNIKSPVRVYCLEKVNYDLGKLNSGYRNPTKYGR